MAVATTTVESTLSRRYESLDALRGIAALAVVLWHVFAQANWSLYVFSFDHLKVGPWCVQVFFLISGFVIPASLERGAPAGRLRALARFWIGRIGRISPSICSA